MAKKKCFRTVIEEQALEARLRRERQQHQEFATNFICDTLTRFYKYLLSFDLDEPKLIKDKYLNPNPLMLFKVYDEREILLTHYMINEGLISVVIKTKAPLLVKGSITQKGIDFLLMEKVFEQL